MNDTPRVALDVIDVPEPCPKDWDQMAGDDRTRFCEGCGRHVHNLSAMSRDEAERLVCERAGRLCVRFERTPSRSVRTLDYAKPASTGRGWRFWSGIGLAGALAASALGAYWNRPQPTRGAVLGALPPVSVSPSAPGSCPSDEGP